MCVVSFKKIETGIFSTVLFTANSAGLYTWLIEFLSYIGKSHIAHDPFLFIGLYHSMSCYSLLSYRNPDPCEECFQHVWGVRWLLGVGRHWGNRPSSVVVYLNRPLEIRGLSLWFRGALHPLER